jgi:hypothetical protein
MWLTRLPKAETMATASRLSMLVIAGREIPPGYHGTAILEFAAGIYGMLGDADHAVSLIERLLAIPSFQHRPAIRLDPKWDSIRSDPRFQKLIAEPAAGD